MRRTVAKKYAVVLMLAWASAWTAAAHATPEPQPQPGDDIADLSLEQLSNIVITSVSRQEERLSNAAASIFIISASDIRRSGAQSLPEALRLAPTCR